MLGTIFNYCNDTLLRRHITDKINAIKLAQWTIPTILSQIAIFLQYN